MSSSDQSSVGWAKLPPTFKIATVAEVIAAIGALGPWSVEVLSVQAWGYMSVWGWLAAILLLIAALANLTSNAKAVENPPNSSLPGLAFLLLGFNMGRVFWVDAELALAWGLPLAVMASGVAIATTFVRPDQTGALEQPVPEKQQVDIHERIKLLADLHEQGILTPSEFEEKKKDLLRRL